MKKKLLFMIAAVFLLLTAIQITILANDVIVTKHNVATTTTNISVFESGRSIINVRYMGYPDVTQGAEITLKIEKKKNMFSWNEVISQTYTTDEAYHMNKFEYSLAEMGTYRFTVIYVISGSAGKEDMIKVCEEKIYDESCPAFPLLYNTVDYEHDCTSADCCEYCYRMIGAMPFASHEGDGTWKLYNNEYHYSHCQNSTVSYVNCFYIIKETHQYDENRVCSVCGYQELSFTEILEGDTVTLTVFADGEIRAYVNPEWLDSEAAELLGCYVEFYYLEREYTIHIPLESYMYYQKNGVKLQIVSQGISFSAVVYPALDIK